MWQWVEELNRHIKPGQVLVKVYLGQPQAAAAAGVGTTASSTGAAAAAAAPALPPGTATAGGDVAATAADLAVADVVLTSYDVLRRDLAAQPQEMTEGEGRSMRRPKRWGGGESTLSSWFWHCGWNDFLICVSDNSKMSAPSPC
jgi:E3 ubiquitin-protein ligase SHPRH